MASATVENVGQDRIPVVIVDGLDDLTEPLRQAAAASRFAPNGPFYPGIRAPVPEGYADRLAQLLAPAVSAAFGEEDEGLVPTASDFSLVTTPPGRLMPFQRLPHFDGTAPDMLAILHYLCDASHGGTSFYRHVSTGFEQVTAGRYDTYKAALEADIARHGLPEAKYRDGTDGLFERIATFDCLPGRVLVYPGTALHSGRIPEGHALSADPRTGRLTVNTFMRRRPARLGTGSS
jgi:hypothetical protein